MKQILYIEDNAPTQMVVSKQLAKLGKVSTASNLADGRRLLHERTFDLLISDVYLPDGKALELIREIRVEHSPEQLPVILLSSSMDQLLRAQAFRVGANDCFPMPSPWPVLLGAVERMLQQSYVQSALRDAVPVTWVEGMMEDRYWLYCAELKLRWEGGDPEALREEATAHIREAIAGGAVLPFVSRVKMTEQLVRTGEGPTPSPRASLEALGPG